jgi:small subunit ribosomal protein S16
MSVKIRMSRMGRRHRPFFRINAIDSRAPRNGRILEKLGHYDPIEKTEDKQLVLDIERVQFWLDKGAVPSDTVSRLLARKGIKTKHAAKKTARIAKAREQARAKGKPFRKIEKQPAEQPAAEAAKPAAKTEQAPAKEEKK